MLQKYFNGLNRKQRILRLAAYLLCILLIIYGLIWNKISVGIGILSLVILLLGDFARKKQIK